MPDATLMSIAKNVWDTHCAARLNQLEQIHADVRGSGRGRRWYTGQLNRSLLVALVGQFQEYCRDLHNEAIDVYLAAANQRQVEVLDTLLKQDRKLDTQNPRRSSLGSDFGRLGIDLIPTLRSRGPKTVSDLERLDELVEFRNAIVHGNESKVESLIKRYQTRMTLHSYRQFRHALDRIVRTMDTVVVIELANGLQIQPPW